MTIRYPNGEPRFPNGTHWERKMKALAACGVVVREGVVTIRYEVAGVTVRAPKRHPSRLTCLACIATNCHHVVRVRNAMHETDPAA